MRLRVQRLLIWPAVALATVALGGWVFDAPRLAGAHFGTPMLPGAILLTLLCSYALLRTGNGSGHDGDLSPSARAAAWAALALSIIGVGRHLIGHGTTLSGADELIGAGWLHVSSAAAIGHGIIATALLLPERLRASSVYPTLLVTPIPALITAYIGYGMDAPALLATPMFSQLALFATICLTCLIAAALLLRPDSGWMAIVTRASPSGQIARRLLLVALLLPPVIALVIQVGRTTGLIAYPFGYAVAAVLTMMGLAAISVFVAGQLRRSEELAQASQNLIEAIVENSPALIYAKDAEGRFLRVNRRFADMMGRPSEDILGRTDVELFPADLAQAYRSIDRKVMETRAPVIEEEQTNFGGRRQTYLSSKAPLVGARGESIGIVGISTDISAQKQVEASLASKVQRLRLLDEITRAIARRQDIASIFQTAVVAVEEQFEADLAAIARVTPCGAFVEVVHLGPATHRQRETFGLSIGRQIRATDNPVGDCLEQRTLVHVDGRDQHVRPGTPPFVNEMGSICVVPILVDDTPYGVVIAARKERTPFDPVECRFMMQLIDHIGLSVQQSMVLQALQQTVEDLKMSQASALARERLAAIGQMASGIAHDLNNALTPISIHTQALREAEIDLPKEIQSYLRMMDRVITDMSATIARMRDFYRPDNLELEHLPTDLRELVSDVVGLTRARWSDMPMQRGVVIGVDTEFEPDLPLALIDAASIRDALTNLILNAVDAMPQGGMIQIRAFRQPASDGGKDERILLEIADTGQGMDAQTRANCLDPFFTTKGERGTGLGLAMVATAAQRHGGDLAIDSEPGKGTAIRMSLPAANPIVAPQPVTRDTQSSPQRAGLRILIVDDDPEVLESTASYLEIIGFDVVAAEGGQRGIDTARAAIAEGRPFHILITDLGMPHVDGDRVAASVKEMAPETFVIMLTGWGSNMPPGRQNPVNVDALMAKPPNIAELRLLLDGFARSAAD